jgi:hypothetical protein
VVFYSPDRNRHLCGKRHAELGPSSATSEAEDVSCGKQTFTLAASLRETSGPSSVIIDSYHVFKAAQSVPLDSAKLQLAFLNIRSSQFQSWLETAYSASGCADQYPRHFGVTKSVFCYNRRLHFRTYVSAS